MVSSDASDMDHDVFVTKCVWWYRTLVFYIQDTTHVRDVQQAATAISERDLRPVDEALLTVGQKVLIQFKSTPFRARVERIQSGHAAITLIDHGKMLDKVPITNLLDIGAMDPRVVDLPGVRTCFIKGFEPKVFQSNKVACGVPVDFELSVKNRRWKEEVIVEEKDNEYEISVVSLVDMNRKSLADLISERLPASSANESDELIYSSETVAVEFAENYTLCARLLRFPTEELKRLEIDLMLAVSTGYFGEAHNPNKDEYVAAQWNSRVIRGIVTSKNGRNAKILLIDYGMETNSIATKLWKIPPSYIARLPPYGLRVTLRGAPEGELTKVVRLTELSLSEESCFKATGVIAEFVDESTEYPKSAVLKKEPPKEVAIRSPSEAVTGVARKSPNKQPSRGTRVNGNPPPKTPMGGPSTHKKPDGLESRSDRQKYSVWSDDDSSPSESELMQPDRNSGGNRKSVGKKIQDFQHGALPERMGASRTEEVIISSSSKIGQYAAKPKRDEKVGQVNPEEGIGDEWTKDDPEGTYRNPGQGPEQHETIQELEPNPEKSSTIDRRSSRPVADSGDHATSEDPKSQVTDEISEGGTDQLKEETPRVAPSTVSSQKAEKNSKGSGDPLELKVANVFTKGHFQAIDLKKHRSITGLIERMEPPKPLKLTDLSIDSVVLASYDGRFARGKVSEIYRYKVVIELFDEGNVIDVKTVYCCSPELAELEECTLIVHSVNPPLQPLNKEEVIHFVPACFEGDTVTGTVLRD